MHGSHRRLFIQFLVRNDIFFFWKVLKAVIPFSSESRFSIADLLDNSNRLIFELSVSKGTYMGSGGFGTSINNSGLLRHAVSIRDFMAYYG